MLRLLVCLSLLLPGVARAGMFDNGAPNGAPLTATGGTVARSAADRAGDLVNVKDMGAKGDGQIATPTVTLSGTSLTVGAGLFSAADVGKAIVVAGAGVAPTIGPVMVVPVQVSGVGYTTTPACSITDGSSSGSGATCSALMGLQSATIATGGSGCAADGTYEFVVTGGSGAYAKITASVIGGSVSGGLTVASQGVLSTLPATLSGVSMYGGGCTTSPTINLSYGISAVQVTAQGSGYSTTQTTAALSGGSPSVAATLGPAIIGAPIPPLVTTIAGYTSPTQVTLADPAATALPAQSAQILWATDDSHAIQSAVSAACHTNKPGGVWIPLGIYWIGAKLAPCTAGDQVVRGEGAGASILVWDAGTVTAQNALGWNPMWGATGVSRAQMRGSLLYEDLQFRGLLDFGRVNTGAAVFEINYFHELAFDRVKFYQIPDMAMAPEGMDFYRVTNSVFENVMRDQARCRSCFNAIVRNNKFIHSDDDSVALHQASSQSGPGNIREGLIVEGNTFEDTSGVALLGARAAVVRGNVFHRTKSGAIRIFADSGEGAFPIQGIVVADNVAQDVLSRPPFSQAPQSVYSVTFNGPASPTGLTRMYPGGNIQGAPDVFARPWDYDINSTYGTAYAAGTRGVTIHDNLYMRTLPATAAMSAWGFGQTMTLAGLYDLPVPDSSIRPISGINVSVNAPDIKIHNNSLHNLQRGITIQDNVVIPEIARVSITFNSISDTWEYGIAGFGSGYTAAYDVIGNQVDVDPYRVSPGRSLDGSGDWANSYGLSKCFLHNYQGVVQLHENTFGQCYTVQTSAGWLMSNNIVRGTPSGLTGQITYSASNHGLGAYPTLAGNQFFVANVATAGANSSPASVGALNVSHATSSAAAPTSGWHAINDMIWSTAPGTCSCIGWLAITTGTGWTAGTDYKVVPIQ